MDEIHNDKEYINDIKLLQIELSPYRYVVIAIQCLSMFLIGLSWVTFSSIYSDFIREFNVSTTVYSLMINIYPICYVVFNFPSCYIIESKSIFSASFIASLLLFVGNVFKYFTPISIYYGFIGNLFCAISQPFIMNLTPSIVCSWNPSNEILYGLLACYMASMIGITTGFYIPGIFFTENSSHDEYITQFKGYVLMLIILTIFNLALNFNFMKSKPDVPPSLSNYEKDSIEGKEEEVFDNKSEYTDYTEIYLGTESKREPMLVEVKRKRGVLFKA